MGNAVLWPGGRSISLRRTWQLRGAEMLGGWVLVLGNVRAKMVERLIGAAPTQEEPLGLVSLRFRKQTVTQM